jgi:hypothetical protein
LELEIVEDRLKYERFAQIILRSLRRLPGGCLHRQAALADSVLLGFLNKNSLSIVGIII